MCTWRRAVWSWSSPSPSCVAQEVRQKHRVVGEGLQETSKSDNASDEHGKLLKEHKDYPLRPRSLEMNKTVFDA